MTKQTFSVLQRQFERTEANAELVQLLAQYLMDNPDQRFGQALRNLNIVRELNSAFGTSLPPQWANEFNTEPSEMLARAQSVLALDFLRET